MLPEVWFPFSSLAPGPTHNVNLEAREAKPQSPAFVFGRAEPTAYPPFLAIGGQMR